MAKQVILKRPPQGSLRYGHPWIYRNQIKEASIEVCPGDVVDVVTESGKFLGRAYWNPKSQISLRVLTRKEEAIDAFFFQRRFSKALESRRQTVRETNSFRLVSSEADGLPGLIVDRYEDVLVVQFLTLGMECLKEIVLKALTECVPHKGIFERSDASVRKLEDLPERVGWIEKHCGDVTVLTEKDIQVELRFGEGHKTGWYLDQRENRFLMREMASGGEALDVFCYEGGFGLQLAKAGMRVLGIESQKDAVERAQTHRTANGIDAEKFTFQTSNAFDALKDLEKSGRKFDLIVLDPPSFVKQKTALQPALSGYKELMLRGFRMMNEGGKLAVFSCAYHLDDHFLMQASLAAAQDARRSLKLLKFMKQSSDHPIDPFIAETYYLKGFLFEVSGS